MADLLPENASEVERAYDRVTGRVDAIPVAVAALWHVDTCPEEHLAWLAWAFSVDEWNPAWPESQKRGAIRAAFDVHRAKGTLHAVRAALEPLGLEIGVTEWFDLEPPGAPYTFSMEARSSVDAPVSSPEALRLLLASVEHTKSLRSHLIGIQVTTGANAKLSVGSAPSVGVDLTLAYGGPVAPSWVTRARRAAAPLIVSTITVEYGGPLDGGTDPDQREFTLEFTREFA